MKKTIYTFLISAFLYSSVVYSQNINKPNFNGPMGLSVNTFTGSLYYERTDLRIPCQGISIDLTFSYNTLDTSLNFGFGRGWTHTYTMFYSYDGSNIYIGRSDGRKDKFTFNGSGYTPPVGIFDTLVQHMPSKFLLKSVDGMKYSFDDSSTHRLTEIRDRNNNAMTFVHAGNKLVKTTDPAGRFVDLHHTGGRLHDITDPNTSPARIVTYDYEYENAYRSGGLSDKYKFSGL